jgi:hypothetical protein
MPGLRLNNEAVHGVGECPLCGAAIHVVGSAQEECIRWCCVVCRTVGSAPLITAEDPGDEHTIGAFAGA